MKLNFGEEWRGKRKINNRVELTKYQKLKQEVVCRLEHQNGLKLTKY